MAAVRREKTDERIRENCVSVVRGATRSLAPDFLGDGASEEDDKEQEEY